MVKELFVSYNQVHNMCMTQAQLIAKEFKPDVMLAIGGGGFIPARILRTFLKIPILAVGVCLYDDYDKKLDKPLQTQWLDDARKAQLKGKRVLVVDEVDDSRETLSYVINTLLNTCSPDSIAVMVLHNKNKKKNAELPSAVKHYYAGAVIENAWIHYPWEALDISEHDAKAQQ